MNASGSCCSPSAARSRPEREAVVVGSGAHDARQVRIPSGMFAMGDHGDDGYGFDGEQPIHRVTMAGFDLDAEPVTNDRFRRFVEATGYVTASERFGSSPVFAGYIAARPEDVLGAAGGPSWWLDVRGADWRHPRGPASSIQELGDHPVVQVSHDDALAYAEWAGRSLPTEAQWEYAARAGRDGARYPWGDDLGAPGERCNIWEGEFPLPAEQQRFGGTSPVGSFEPDARGLVDMVGNVWEWCSDWFDPGYYAMSPAHDPRGPVEGRLRVVRGGSHLCHISYCNRYRVAARTGADPGTASSNTGFRTCSATGSEEP